MFFMIYHNIDHIFYIYIYVYIYIHHIPYTYIMYHILYISYIVYQLLYIIYYITYSDIMYQISYSNIVSIYVLYHISFVTYYIVHIIEYTRVYILLNIVCYVVLLWCAVWLPQKAALQLDRHSEPHCSPQEHRLICWEWPAIPRLDSTVPRKKSALAWSIMKCCQICQQLDSIYSPSFSQRAIHHLKGAKRYSTRAVAQGAWDTLAQYSLLQHFKGHSCSLLATLPGGNPSLNNGLNSRLDRVGNRGKHLGTDWFKMT